MAETLRAGGLVEEAETAARWYACYTRARHEKQVHRLMEGRGMESFLPLVPRVSQWKDRKKLIEWPLFPSYVFVRCAQGDLHEVVSLPGVTTVVRTNGRPVAIEDSEMNNIRSFARALRGGNVEVERRPYYAEGAWVEVTEGAFAGVRGVVVERRGERRVVVGLKAIGQGLEVNVDTRLLKPVTPS
jgi:transcription antitermination factor NusG